MRIFVRVLRIFTILAVAAISVTAIQAQSDDDDDAPAARKSCADVKPPAVNPADTISSIPIYVIAPGTSGHRARCRATEALAEGMVDVEFSEDRVLAEALGDPVPNTDTGDVSVFPYLAPDSRPTPGLPPPGPGAEHPVGSHLYAAFIDRKTGVEYTFSSVAGNVADTEAAAIKWVHSTVEPLLEPDAAKANTQAAADVAFATADATFGTPKYDPRAWHFLIDATISMPDNQLWAGGVIHGHGRVMGQSGAVVRVYRLNANKQGASDYFLVDTAYTQTPRYDPFDFGFLNSQDGRFWANAKTQLTLTAKNPDASTGIKPTLSSFAPQTPVTGRTETFQVGAELSGSVGSVEGGGGGISAGYSVTTTQESVETTVNATLTADNLRWSDKYNGFGDLFVKPPSTSINTFTGERLAIFKVPRTINDVSNGGVAGLNFTPYLYSQVQGYVKDKVIGNPFINLEYADWHITSLLFAPEPQFSATPTAITVSKSANNTDNPVIIKVVAQLPDGAQEITWRVKAPDIVATNVSSGITGSGELRIVPASGAEVGDDGYIFLDSVPSHAADSLRKGPIQITVKIVP